MATSVPRLKQAIIDLISSTGVVIDSTKRDFIAQELATAIVFEITSGTVTVPNIETGIDTAQGTIT